MMSHLRLKSFHLHHRAKSPKTKLLDLDTDITIMIFDVLRNLQESHRRSMLLDDRVTENTYQPHTWRLVCREWNEILIARVFSRVDSGFNSFRRKLDLDDETYQRVLMNIRNHARHATVHVGFLPNSNYQARLIQLEDTVEILLGCEKLESIQCQFVPLLRKQIKAKEVTEIPKVLYDMFLERPRLQVLFDCPRMTNLVCRQEFSNLVSVTVEMDSAETNLQEFLASSHNLEFLSIRCLNGHRFSPSKGKIPAIKHLELKNYPWCHSLDETALIWDFSKLETLFLHSKRSHSNGAFLRSAATRPFPRLKKLNSRHPIPYSASAVVYDVFNPSPGLELRSFILSLPMLEDLTIHQFCPEILVPCIVKIGSNLRKLRMHVGKHQFLRDVELLDIQRSCPNLETLGLHRDPEKDQSGTAFLKALCGFEKVRWLKIEYRTFSQMSDTEGKKVYRYIKAKKSGSRLDRFEFVNHVNEFHWLRTHIRRFSPELSKWVS